MSYSIYEVDGGQDIAKPADSTYYPNEGIWDVFFMTRPELFDFDKSSEANPFYYFYNIDESTHDKEFSDFNYIYSPYQDRQDIFVKANEIISDTRFANNPVEFYLFDKSNVKTAVSLNDLARTTSHFSISNAPRCVPRVLKADPKRLMWSYHVNCYSKDSDPKGHVVSIKLGAMPKERDIRKLKVKVSCSCPFWKFYGPDFNAKVNDYLLLPQKSDGSAPDKNDPQRKNKICKHVYVVSEVFRKFAAKYNLDTYKDIEALITLLSKETDPEFLFDMQEILPNLNRSAQTKISPLVKRYSAEKNEKLKEHLKSQILTTLDKVLELQSKEEIEKLIEIAKRKKPKEVTEIPKLNLKPIKDKIKNLKPEDKKDILPLIDKLEKSKTDKEKNTFLDKVLSKFNEMITKVKKLFKKSEAQQRLSVERVIAMYLDQKKE